MKPIFKTVLTAFFPFFGLVSCQSNQSPEPKASAPVIEKADEWRLPKPRLYVPAEPMPRNWDDLSGKSIPVESVIQFSKDAPLAQVKFTSVADCTLNGRNLKTTLQFREAHQIPLKSLLPVDEFFKDPSNPFAQQLECHFSIAAVNPIGSTHIFKMGPVSFTNLDRLENSTFDFNSTKDETEALATHLIYVDAIHPSPSENGGLEVKSTHHVLQCEDLRSERVVDGNASDPKSVFAELTQGPLLPGTQTIDPRDFVRDRQCRLIQRSIDGQTGLPLYRVTPRRHLFWPMQKVTLEWTMKLGAVSAETYNTHPIAELKIYNPGSKPALVSLKNFESAIQFQLIYRSTGRVVGGPSIQDSYVTEAQGIPRHWKDDGRWMLEVPAQSSGTIVFRLAAARSCHLPLSHEAMVPHFAGRAFLGMKYAWPAPPEIEQYRNWNPIDSKMSIPMPMDLPTRFQRDVTANFGWVPHAFQQSVLPSEAPTVQPSRADDFDQNGCLNPFSGVPRPEHRPNPRFY